MTETLNKSSNSITLEENISIKKSKLLYCLHIIVPMGLVLFSTISMILAFFQVPTNETHLNLQYNNTTQNNTTELSDKEILLDFLNLNNRNNQVILGYVINAFNLLFGVLSVIYSKMMNNESHNLGTDNIKLKTEKNVLLEQITSLTTSLSHPASARMPIIFPQHSYTKEHIPSLTSNLTPMESNNEPLQTGRSDSTVYIRPYNHEPIV